ncbi:MAG: AAA family ATPase, partial [Acidimicrobiales bacterium]
MIGLAGKGDETLRAPRVLWLSIDGYGALNNLEVAGLDQGITVLIGPNEAGKSTLFDFLTTILFGFPSRKSDDRYRAPLTGNRHGGRIGLRDSAGRDWIIERHAAPQKRLRITRPDGSLGEEADLRRLLGGANAELFRAVFAVDLDDLRRLDGMSSDEVREVLFSSSILGQRRSAARAMRALEARRDLLVRPRQGGRANQLADELKEARRQLADARSSAERFAALSADSDRLARTVSELKERQEAAQAEIRDFNVLHQCWQAVTRQRQLEGQLGELAELSHQERELLAAKGQVAAVGAQYSGHLERMSTYRQALGRHLALVGSVEQRTNDLGGTWSTALAADDAFDPESLGSELRQLLDQVTEARAQLAAASSVLAKTSEEAESLRRSAATGGVAANGSGTELPGAAELAERLASLRELWSWINRIEQLGRETERDAEMEQHRAAAAGRAAPSVTRGFLLVSMVVCLLLLLVAGMLISQHQVLLAGGLLVAAAVTALLAWWAARANGVGHWTSRAESDAEDTGQSSVPPPVEALRAAFRDRLAALEQAKVRAASLASTLGLGDEATSASAIGIERTIADTESRIEARRQLDRQLEALGSARDRVARAQADEQEAAARLRAAESAVLRLASASRLPEGTDLPQLPSLVAELGDLGERLRALQRVEDDLRSSEGAIRAFEDRVLQLADRFELSPPPTAHEGTSQGLAVKAAIQLPEEQLSDLLDRINTTFEGLERRATELSRLHDALEGATHEIDRILGDGDRAARLRKKLVSGRVLDWDAERDAAKERVEQLELEYEQTLREHEGLQRELRELAASSDIPRLELSCLELEEDLRKVMREYLVASGSHLLLQRTLKRYQDQRQPVVLERAAGHFARVTSSRYVRVVVDAAGDGAKPSIGVIRPDGTSVDATDLSRGTMEQ